MLTVLLLIGCSEPATKVVTGSVIEKRYCPDPDDTEWCGYEAQSHYVIVVAVSDSNTCTAAMGIPLCYYFVPVSEAEYAVIEDGDIDIRLTQDWIGWFYPQLETEVLK